jgi:adenylate cyclase
MISDFWKPTCASLRRLPVDHELRYLFYVWDYSHTLESIKQFEKAMRLDPYYPAWMLNVMIRSYVLAGKYDEAQMAIRQQLDRNPGNFFTGQAHLNLAVVYSSLGQQEKAKVELPKALDVFPKMTLSFIHREVDCSDETFVADYFDTLEKLGLPE